MKRTFEIDPWKVITHELNPEDKRLQESMTSIGNEYMGMRGMFEEKYSGDTHQGIYLGGVWYPDKTRVGWWKNGYPEYFGKIPNAIDFVSLDIKINGESIDLAKDSYTDFELCLDMKRGVLDRSFIVEKDGHKIQVTSERFVSIDFKELYANKLTFTNLSDEPVKIEVQSLINADVYNEDSNYGEQFWGVLDKEVADKTGRLVGKTAENNFDIPRFTVEMVMSHETQLEAAKSENMEKAVANNFEGTLDPDKTVSFEKRVIVTTSRDYETREDLDAATTELMNKAGEQTYDQLVEAQANAWAKRWEKSDITIDGDEAAQQGIRFNLFQLFSTYYGNDARLNIGPKGFTGEKYGGATYWDTEAFCLPVYLGTSDPQVPKNLLKYRHNQLDGAFHNAQQQGLKGALYPMVTFNGVECHNEWEITFEEIHRNSDIAYAIYNYTKTTGDKSYVLNEGSEVLVAIARFWADRVHFSQRHGQYMIHGVTGADEYENNVDNNWYTNVTAKWELQYTLDILKEVSSEQAAKLNVTDDEKAKWQDIVDKMYLPEDKELGIFVQHDGFLDKDITLDENNNPINTIPADELPINQNWSWDKILRSPYVKQADVLQAMWYFMDDFTEEQKKRNFDFYEPLTVHESSLSASIYAIMAADLRYEEKSVELYERTARLDLDNYNNDTEDGLHITAMSGGWLAIVEGFAGMRVNDDQLQFKPFVPKAWNGYKFRLYFRDRLLEINVTKENTEVKLLKGEPLTIKLNGEDTEIK
ncbi:glycoside hydrolase family 65 protein [Ligilactobacillus sp. LYQ135]